MFGLKVAGTVERFTFVRGVSPSTAVFSKFSDDLLIAAQRRAYRIPNAIQEVDYRQIWMERVQLIRPEVLMYRAAFALMARGIAAKLVVQAIRKDGVPVVLDLLAPMFVYTTKSLAQSLDSTATIWEFLLEAADGRDRSSTLRCRRTGTLISFSCSSEIQMRRFGFYSTKRLLWMLLPIRRKHGGRSGRRGEALGQSVRAQSSQAPANAGAFFVLAVDCVADSDRRAGCCSVAASSAWGGGCA